MSNNDAKTSIGSLKSAIKQTIGLMSREFTNGLGDRVLILGQVIPKTQKMVLDVALLNTQYYKVGIKDKMEQSKEMEWHPPLHLGVVAIEKGAFVLQMPVGPILN